MAPFSRYLSCLEQRVLGVAIVVSGLSFLHISQLLFLVACVQGPRLQHIASCGQQLPSPPFHESLKWTASNTLRQNIALSKEPQVEIVSAFCSLAKQL